MLEQGVLDILMDGLNDVLGIGLGVFKLPDIFFQNEIQLHSLLKMNQKISRIYSIGAQQFELSQLLNNKGVVQVNKHYNRDYSDWSVVVENIKRNSHSTHDVNLNI